MQFLCDVHISYKLCKHLQNQGFTCVHINMILDRWHTTDQSICQYADANDYVVITKDEDFRTSHLLRKTPRKLIKIVLGNISNQRLITLFNDYIPLLLPLDKDEPFFVELGDSFVLYTSSTDSKN